VREAIIPDVMLAIEVMNKDDGQIVFEERVPMTNTGSTVPNTPVATWSGTLSPTDWTGGCQDAQYMINTAVYRRAGYPTGDPFEPVWPSVERAFNVTGGSFICNGS
jgi:hypothetical protein